MRHYISEQGLVLPSIEIATISCKITTLGSDSWTTLWTSYSPPTYLLQNSFFDFMIFPSNFDQGNFFVSWCVYFPFDNLQKGLFIYQIILYFQWDVAYHMFGIIHILFVIQHMGLVSQKAKPLEGKNFSPSMTVTQQLNGPPVNNKRKSAQIALKIKIIRRSALPHCWVTKNHCLNIRHVFHSTNTIVYPPGPIVLSNISSRCWFFRSQTVAK